MVFKKVTETTNSGTAIFPSVKVRSKEPVLNPFALSVAFLPIDCNL